MYVLLSRQAAVPRPPSWLPTELLLKVYRYVGDRTWPRKKEEH